LNRVPSCAIRARRWLSTGLAGSGGAAFPLKTGSVLLLGTTFLLFAFFLCVFASLREVFSG
jgi:hypothetical protein